MKTIYITFAVQVLLFVISLALTLVSFSILGLLCTLFIGALVVFAWYGVGGVKWGREFYGR